MQVFTCVVLMAECVETQQPLQASGGCCASQSHPPAADAISGPVRRTRVDSRPFSHGCAVSTAVLAFPGSQMLQMMRDTPANEASSLDSCGYVRGVFCASDVACCMNLEGLDLFLLAVCGEKERI